MVALIPARAGSKRIPGKNTRLLAGEPLLAWTIRAAYASGVFDEVIVSSEDSAIGQIAERAAAYWLPRPAALATDESPDIAWVRDAFKMQIVERAQAFAILRPTSPFRTAETIKRAFRQFTHDEAHSLRAMQPVKEHPGKMWQVAGAGYPAVPLIGAGWPTPTGATFRASGDTPWHSQPTQALPKVYVQNASLEMAWSYVIHAFGTISGTKIAPFFTEGYEGFDLNTEDDWDQAERLIAEGKVARPALAAL
jgi:N-acylneuraminate cytidylyltransferase